MNILVISKGAWRNDNNTGNTLSNIFGGMQNSEFYNIYCSAEMPENDVCKSYYRISEPELMKHFFDRNYIAGKRFSYNFSETKPHDVKEKDDLKFFKLNRCELFYLYRELIWNKKKWQNSELDSYISDISPDIIFMPAYDSVYMYDIFEYVALKTKGKAVLVFTDDYFSFNQRSFSIFFWIRRILIRHVLKKRLDLFNGLYAVSDLMKEEYEKLFRREFKTLYKGDCFEEKSVENRHKPLKLLYAGNIMAGRWKSLKEISRAIEKINADKLQMQLYIYTRNAVSDKIKDALNNGKNSFFCGGITAEKVKQEIDSADVLVHIESLQGGDKLKTRLSFSTKLVDYFKAGKCIFAVGWEQAASINYLIKHDAALVAGNKNEIEINLRNIIENESILDEYGKKAWECGKQNHQIDKIQTSLYKDFEALINDK